MSASGAAVLLPEGDGFGAKGLETAVYVGGADKLSCHGTASGW